MYLEMKVCDFTLDSFAQMPVVFLKDAEEKNTLPIWINSMDAVSLTAELINKDMSVEGGCCDLMTKLMDQLCLKIDRITIDSLNHGIFDVLIFFSGNGKETSIKVRPSEALIMALKYNMSVHVAKEVIEQASVLTATDDEINIDIDASRYIDFLENLDLEDLGKYPM
jgi:bifunctional DNase/RNase